jgi:DNA-binding transcriptional MocR family regulator
MGIWVIEFHLKAHSGIAPYLQIVGQVREALLLGLLAEGDKLPTVKEVVAKVAINPNTVSKAYRELEHLGLAAAKPGVAPSSPGPWARPRSPSTARSRTSCARGWPRPAPRV